jgi:8-oxo-dGTP diphosphatase
LITRGHPPFLGRLAFPGGHLDYNEDPRECVLRELKEETCLTGELKELITVKGDPLRDTRGHYVTIAYRVEVAPHAEPKAADDAATANWYDLEEALNKGKTNKCIIY